MSLIIIKELFVLYFYLRNGDYGWLFIYKSWYLYAQHNIIKIWV